MLVFDFDGILLDSVREATVTAYNALTGRTLTSVSEMDPAVFGFFVRNRFHFQPAGDAIPLMAYCIKEAARNPERILSRAEYAAVVGHEQRAVKDRTADFFQARARFMKKDMNAWYALNAVYQPLFSELKILGAEFVLILTNKNQTAVIESCRHFGIELQAQNVYSGDGGVTKIENFSRLKARFPKEKFFFIDDSVSNLMELESALNRPIKQLDLMLGAWGYVGSEDLPLAEKSGFKIWQQPDFIEAIKNDNFGPWRWRE